MVTALQEDQVYPGWIGLVFFLALVVAVVLLALSMRKHLGRIDVDRPRRDPPERGEDPGSG